MSNLIEPEFENHNSVAIIGLSGRFPKAQNIDEFWSNLRAGVECIEQYSEETLLKSGIDPIHLQDPNYVRAGALVADTDKFDAKFFEMTGSEAAIADPQHRLFLEVAWEALEMAGYCKKDYEGLVGVYAGASFSRYFFQCILQNKELMESFSPMQLMIGSDKDSLCTTLSYKLNLRGPSVTVQTACSTSLVAVHMACQAILNGECDIALAGGVAVRSFSEEGYPYVQGDISSPDGHCRTFDASAAGTVSGNGLGIVVLKKLQDALADGDTIHAVVRGSAINNDGSQKVGFTAPSVNGQMAVIAEALAASGVDPEEISYLEAHGTGTVLGDPIELTALSHAYASETFQKNACAIGALKTNIGHLDTAAGVAGLIKVALALKNKEIPPTLHFKTPNPNFDLENSPFYINTALKEWTTDHASRIAGVSSFGIGGTNAHVIVEEAPALPPSSASRWPASFLVSAKTATAKLTAIRRLKAFLVAHPGISLSDAAFTTQVGRESFEFRESFVCQSREDAILQLDAKGETASKAKASQHQKRPFVVFMFPGQGTQYINMAQSLYETETAFAAELDRCMNLFASLHAIDLSSAIFPSTGKQDEAAVRINETHITQPALFAVEYALARFLESLGVKPSAMVGHSVGEYVAACLAGVFSLEDAVRLVGERGKLMAKSPTGAMLVVHAGETQVAKMLGNDLWIAAVNSSSSCAVSGTPSAIDALQKECEGLHISTQLLRVTRAFHSGLLKGVSEEFRSCLARVTFSAPKLGFVSNVSGSWIQPQQAMDPQYWIDHLLKPVRFADCVQTLAKENDAIWVEVGPGKALSSLVKFNLTPNSERLALATLPDIQLRERPHQLMATVLGQLWEKGVQVCWADLYGGENRRRIPLPTYPFERERYWVEPSKEQDVAVAHASRNDREPDFAKWFYAPSWRREDVGAARGAAPVQKGPILVFGTDSAQWSSIQKSLASLGVRVLLAEKADKLYLGASDRFTIDPANSEHYQALFAHLVTQNLLPSALLHMWSLAAENPVKVEDEVDEYHHLLGLARVLGNIEHSEKISLTVIGDGAYSVLGNEVLRPGQALIAAACKVIPLEYKNLNVRYFDVLPGDLVNPDWRLAGLVSRDMLSNDGSKLVAYRGAYRWLEDVRAVEPSTGASSFTVRDDGVYLITGGLGGIGLVFAQYLLASAKAPKIVLVGRAALPDSATWDSYLSAHGSDDATSKKILSLLALEQRGALVRYVSADVGVAEDVARLASVVSEVGALSGIFHAAGIGDISLLHFRTREFGNRVLAPKVMGTLLLEKSFAFEKLDFVLLCSSINAVCPTLGQADYCAANSFLDAFAQKRSALDGANVVSLNWGSWHETGMTKSDQPADLVSGLVETPSSVIGIKTDDAAPVFGWLQKLSLPQLVVLPYSYARIEKLIASANAGVLGADDAYAEAEGEDGSGSLLMGEMNDAAATTEFRLLALWKHLFGSQSIGADDNFFEIGGHSLLALQMAARIRDLFQVNLGLHNIFEVPTVNLLAKRIDAATAEKADALSKSRKEAVSKLDGMSREELLKLLEEKRRAKLNVE